MEYTTSWMTVTEPDWGANFNHAADLTYGTLCFLCFLIGTLGNTASFFYFNTRKRDIPNVIYMMVTVNDVIISITVLPVGISFWSGRKPGLMFGSGYGCVIWFYLWTIAVPSSIFLVMCISITRTISLVKPFERLKVRYLIVVVITYMLLHVVRIIRCHLLGGIGIKYLPWLARPVIFLSGEHNTAILLFLEISRNLTYIAPAVPVAASCIIAVVLLKKKNDYTAREHHKSRRRATVTILMFAALYGICNIPLVVELFLGTYSRHNDKIDWYFDLFTFDEQSYYYNAMNTLLLAANSAANPILYFWRMPPLRRCILVRIKRPFSWGRDTMQTLPDIAQHCPGNRVVLNNNITRSLPDFTAKSFPMSGYNRPSNDQL